MDARTDPTQFVTPEAAVPVGNRLLRRLADIAMGWATTLVLAVVALLFGVGTFFVLADGATAISPDLIMGLVVANLTVLMLLFAVLAGKLTRVWRERRHGRAGAKLHVRLVLLFGVVATVPSILVALFASAFFHYGIQAWFNDRVRTALHEGLEASQGYLTENQYDIKSDAVLMAEDLTRDGATAPLGLDSQAFADDLTKECYLRGLTEALIFEPTSVQRIAAAGIGGGYGIAIPSTVAINSAKSGDVPVIVSDDGTTVRAVVALNFTVPLMLVVGRQVDRTILDHMQRTQQAVNEYTRLDQNRSGLQVTFTLIFAILALLMLSAAVLLGVLLGIALCLALALNTLSLKLAFVGAALMLSYPLLKRFFPLPQLYLGLSFGWAVPLAFAATVNSVPRVAWLMLIAAVLWAGVYDTEYAMADRDDDRRIGVQSSAILFGDMDRLMIGGMQLMVLLALLLIGRSLHFDLAYACALAAGACLFAWQQWLIRERDREHCLLAFQNNNYFGIAVLAGILIEYAPGP